MQEIKVDPYGIKVMAPKAVTHLVRINSLSCIAANILKQEMLSLGADVAVSRDTLTGRTRQTDCLLIGNLAQLGRLNNKLNRQPFGLNRLAQELTCAVDNYEKDNFSLVLGRFKLNLRPRRASIMGIVNLTPDSFSADGLLQGLSPSTQRTVLEGTVPEYIERLVRDGADIIDIGGESTRPGARPVSIKEESRRVIPVIKKIAQRIKVPISIDTYKPEVADRALDNGAVMVNDITGLRNPKMAKVISKYKAGLVIMHMKGKPRTMQKKPAYRALLDEIMEYLDKAIDRAVESGINKGKIIIDPGIGFGKTLEHNLEILRRLEEFKILGRPIMVGPSRKSFIGKILKVEPEKRIFGTLASAVLAIKNGASMVRVHDVKAVKEALAILDAVSVNSP
jgi:dihydropteroate synthase